MRVQDKLIFIPPSIYLKRENTSPTVKHLLLILTTDLGIYHSAN